MDRWIEQHIDEILDSYVQTRITRYGDTRTPQQMRDAVRELVREIGPHLRGQSNWEDFWAKLRAQHMTNEKTLEEYSSSVAGIADVCQALYFCIFDVMRRHNVPELEQWQLKLVEEMLDGSRWAARALDDMLSYNLKIVEAGVREQEKLQQQVIDAQQMAIRELSTPIIPILEGMIVLPVVGSVDTLRARDILRALLAGIRAHRAKVVIVDVTGGDGDRHGRVRTISPRPSRLRG